jgi:hypothetical protein
MHSSLTGKVPEYLGADLTDRYSPGCRKIDVCGLTPGADNTLNATFWHWTWDPAPIPLDVTAIANELNAASGAMLDGPQGLAAKGTHLRGCERQSAAVGKTRATRPDLALPFAGFICSSLDLFAALQHSGTTISPSDFVGGASEVYPGHIWTILNARHFLPRKSTAPGRSARKSILEALGVRGLPNHPNHDQNDACVAALLAAAADGKVPGVTVRRLGTLLSTDPDGTLREGQMVIPEVSPESAESISRALANLPRFAPTRPAAPLAGSDEVQSRANTLLDRLIDKALGGDPRVCTYLSTYQRLFNAPNVPWLQAYAHQVVSVACRTPLRELSGLGYVRLDAFGVRQEDRLPGIGHWDSAQYDVEDWERVLGDADLCTDANC